MNNVVSNNTKGNINMTENSMTNPEEGVMIVDDSKFSRKILSEILIAEGFTIIAEAKNGLEAIEMAKEKKPKYVFLDVQMPVLDGLGALPKILEVHPEANVIMCTAMGQQNIILEAAKAGAKDYVLKPFKSENIISVMNAIMISEYKEGHVIPFNKKRKEMEKAAGIGFQANEDKPAIKSEESAETKEPEATVTKAEAVPTGKAQKQTITEAQEQIEEVETKIVQEEVDKVETVQAETVREGVDKAETVQAETVQKEVVKDETVKDEAILDEAVLEETVRDETVQDEVVQEEAVQDEVVSGEKEQIDTIQEEAEAESEQQLEAMQEVISVEEEQTEAVIEEMASELPPISEIQDENQIEAIQEELPPLEENQVEIIQEEIPPVEETIAAVVQEETEELPEAEIQEEVLKESSEEAVKNELDQETGKEQDQDNIIQESQESLVQDDLVQEEIIQEEIVQEEPIQKEAVQEEKTQEEIAQKEVPQKETAQEEEKIAESVPIKSGFKYLWENRFESGSRQEKRPEPVHQRVSSYSMLHSASDIDYADSLNMELMAGIVGAYLGFSGRLQVEYPYPDSTRNDKQPVMRISVKSIVPMKNRTTITMSELLRLTGRRGQNSAVNLSKAIELLVQEKGKRTLA